MKSVSAGGTLPQGTVALNIQPKLQWKGWITKYSRLLILLNLWQDLKMDV